MGPALYREAFFEALEKDYVPRFEALGISGIRSTCVPAAALPGR